MSNRSTIKKRPLLLFDRDGTLVEEVGFPSDPAQVRLFPGVPQALRKLKKAGYRLVVVTNQSGVGRGLVTLAQLHSVNRRFLQLLKAKKAQVDGLYWCPHHPKDRCPCRKPKLGLVRRAARDLGISWKDSISVGDRRSDVELGQRTGGKGILVLTGYGRRWKKTRGAAQPDHTAKTFVTAANWILKQERKQI